VKNNNKNIKTVTSRSPGEDEKNRRKNKKMLHLHLTWSKKGEEQPKRLEISLSCYISVLKNIPPPSGHRLHVSFFSTDLL
jgi:hypothetical protein